MTKYSLLFFTIFYGQLLSQMADSLKSIDTTRAIDTLRISDTLQIRPEKSGSDSLRPIEDSLESSTINRKNSELAGEGPQEPIKKPSIKDLHFLIGKWKGEGWRMMPGGQKRYIVQTEIVESKQNGDVLIIEGVGIDRESLRTKPRVVHNAFAIIYYNSEIQNIQIMAFNRGRRIVTQPDIINERGFQWGFIIPEVGQVRYLVQLTDQGEWIETGEFSRDGQQWTQNFEMTLTRIE